ncbi:hypothetical protein ACFLX8_04255 [Chloroflexota bacterium]
MKGKLIWPIFWVLVGTFILNIISMFLPPVRLGNVFVSLYLFYFVWVAFLVSGIIFLVLTKKGKTKGVLRGFQFLMGASAVGLPLSAVLHNVVSALLNVEEPVFFMMAVFVCPLGFLVGALGTIVINIRRKQVKQSS